MDKFLEITGHCKRNNCAFIAENTEKKISVFNHCHNRNLIQFTNSKGHLLLPHLSCPFRSQRPHHTELSTNLLKINISSFTFFLPTDKSQ